MKIAICGSMKFAKEMWQAYQDLTEKGHEVFLPKSVREYAEGTLGWQLGSLSREEGAERKKQYDLIREHYRTIQESDAILVINLEKNGIKNYIGANTFLEMGFAHILNKPIYLLNGLPESDYLIEEAKAMEPIVLAGDLSQLENPLLNRKQKQGCDNKSVGDMNLEA